MSKYDKLGNNGAKQNGKPRVAFYTRISTDEDHQKYSLDAQKERLEAFCKAQHGDDWVFFKLYRDTESGTHMNRPGLEEMLYDAESKAFDTLLVFRVDRLSRKVRELAQMVDELTKYNVVLRSITEPFDTANAAGKMMLQMLGVFAEFEHATIVERTKVGLEKKAKTGKFVGGIVPFGYTLDPEKGLIVNEEESVVIKKMFKMYAFGREGTWAISNNLNQAGYRKRSGKKWDKRVVLDILRNPVYIGKIRWSQIIYDGLHEPIISEILFDKAREVLEQRNEELKGRQFHNVDERLLSGTMKCGKCGSHMFGGGGTKNGRYIPYYVCSKRYTQHECEQDYVRADLLEASLVEDVKAMFRDEQLMARIWAEANKRLEAEKPDIEKEIRRLEDRAIKTQARIDKYFEAFEEGKLKAEACNDKVEDLNARLRELASEKKELEARRKKLELQPLDKEMLKSLIDNFEEVMAAGTNPQKKHLLKLLVKKVLVHDRRTIEVWYCLPNTGRFEHREEKLPECARFRTRKGEPEPEVFFRIIHLTHRNNGKNDYRKQEVEIALGPKAVFGNGDPGSMGRQMPEGRVVSAIPPPRGSPRPLREPKTPRVAELLRKAIEWQRLLETGTVPSQAEIARQEGLTRARVTQILSLLNLAPKIQKHILSMPRTARQPVVTERSLRPITAIEDYRRQKEMFAELQGP